MQDENVIELKPNTAVQILEQLMEMAKKGELEQLIFCGKVKDLGMISGSFGATPFEEQTLISYIQLNTFEKFMSCRKENLMDK